MLKIDTELQHVSNVAAPCACLWEGGHAIAFFSRYSLFVMPHSGNIGTAQSTQRAIQVAGKLDVAHGNNGKGWEARFDSVCGMIFCESRRALIISDTGNNRVRMGSLTSPYMVSTLCGAAQIGHKDGKFANATFHFPYGVAANSSGSMIYVTDNGNHAVREIDMAAGTTRTLYNRGLLEHPTSIRIDKDAFLLVVCSSTDQVLRLGIHNSSIGVVAPEQTEFDLESAIKITPGGKFLMYRTSLVNSGCYTMSVRDQQSAGIVLSIDMTMPLHNITFVDNTMYSLINKRLYKLHFELDAAVVQLLFLAVQTRKQTLNVINIDMLLRLFSIERSLFLRRKQAISVIPSITYLLWAALSSHML